MAPVAKLHGKKNVVKHDIAAAVSAFLLCCAATQPVAMQTVAAQAAADEAKKGQPL